MNNEMIRAAVAMTVFGTVLLGLACGVSQNGNLSQGQNREEASPATKDSDVCDSDSEPLVAKLHFVNDGLDKSFRADKWLADQYIPNPPATSPSFEYRVIGIMNGARWPHLIVLVEGTILEAKDPNGKNKDKNLAAFGRVVKEYLRPKCVQRVVFVPDGTLAQLPPGDLVDPPILIDAARRGDRDVARNIALNSEWSYCQWPDRPCSDGTCNAACARDGGNSANTNSTTNSNSSNSNNNGNTNANANVNANANSGRTSP